MTDRNVQFPNRFQLVPVPGTTNIFDLTPAPGTVYENGTFWNKQNVLQDDTAALYSGLPENPTPDDVFRNIHLSIFGQDYTLYKWIRTKIIYSYLIDAEIISPEHFVGFTLNTSATIRYSNTVYFDSSNNLVLSNPSVYSKKLSDILQTDGNLLVGKYFTLKNSSTVYYGSGSSIGLRRTGNSSDGYYVKVSAASRVKINQKEVTEIVSSTDPNAYPVEGDGWTYTQMPSEAPRPGRAQVITGSYVGTGKSGAENPNQLSFDFTPKVVMIWGLTENHYQSQTLTFVRGASEHSVVDSPFNVKSISWGDKSVTWYGGKPSEQLNYANYVYYYTAIG